MSSRRPSAVHADVNQSRWASDPLTPMRYSAMWAFCDATDTSPSGSLLYVSGYRASGTDHVGIPCATDSS